LRGHGSESHLLVLKARQSDRARAIYVSLNRTCWY